MNGYTRKLTFYECLDEEALVVVVRDMNDKVIASDLFSAPMYSTEECIETVFKGENEIISAINYYVERGDLDGIKKVAREYQIEFEDILIDYYLYHLLLRELEYED